MASVQFKLGASILLLVVIPLYFVSQKPVEHVDFKMEDSVLVMTDKNFEYLLHEASIILIKFYAPWCGHCKKLSPEFSAASNELIRDKSQVVLAQVDATQETKIAQQFQIQGYPTLFYYINGDFIEYDGPRQKQGIIDWVRNRTSTRARYVKGVEEVEKTVQSNDLVALYLSSEQYEDKQLRAFQSASILFEDIVFLYTYSSAVGKRYELSTMYHDVIFFRKFEEKWVKFNNNSYDFNELRNFLDDFQFPVPVPFNKKGARKLFAKAEPCVILLSNGDQTIESMFSSAAQSFGNAQVPRFGLATSRDQQQMEQMFETFGFTDANLPIVIGFDSENKKYVHRGNLTDASIKKFRNQLKQNKLAPYFKSEPLPDNSNLAVKKIVRNNYDSEIVRTNKDVFLKIYAPWCGHCKILAPIFEKTAEKLKNNPNIVFAELDYTANEIPQIRIQSYPTLYFYKGANKNNPIKYEGDRSESDMIAFLRNNTSHKWVEPVEKAEQ